MAAHPPPGRREADQLLLLLLRENGCYLPAGVTSVEQLSSDALIRAVGSITSGIDGSRPPIEAFSTRGSHPAERLHACRLVAGRVRDVGYAEPFSAHQLMYPGGEDTRELLLELLSMLPPEGVPVLPAQPSPGARSPPLPGQEQQRHQQPRPQQQGAHDFLSGDPSENAVEGNDPVTSDVGVRHENGGDAASQSEEGGDGSEEESAAAAAADGDQDGGDAASTAGRGGDGDEVASSAAGATEVEDAASSPPGEEQVENGDQLGAAGTKENGDGAASLLAGGDAEIGKQSAAVLVDEYGHYPAPMGEEKQGEREGAAEPLARSADNCTLEGKEELGERGDDEEEEEEEYEEGSAGHEAEADTPPATGVVEAVVGFSQSPDGEGTAVGEATADEGEGAAEAEEATSTEPAPPGPADNQATFRRWSSNPPAGSDTGGDDSSSLHASLDNPWHDELTEGGEEDGEENVFGPVDSSEAEASATRAFQTREDVEGEEEAEVDMLAAAEANATGALAGEEGGEEAEFDVFGLTEPSEAVLGGRSSATAAPRARTEGWEEEEKAGNVLGPTVQPAADLSAEPVPPEGRATESDATPVRRAFDSDAAQVIGNRDAALRDDVQDVERDLTGETNSPLAVQARDSGLTQAREAEGLGEEGIAGPSGPTPGGAGDGGEGSCAVSGEDGGLGDDQRVGSASVEAQDSESGGGGGGGDVEAKSAAPDGKSRGVLDAAAVRAGLLEGHSQGPESVSSVEGGREGESGEIGTDRTAPPGERGDNDDVVFLQFELEAKELELTRLLTEAEVDNDEADKLEEEVGRLGALAAEKEKYCRSSAKALELFPNAEAETTELQKRCAAAEARMQAARKAFDKAMKPLEATVRLQREELARRKARCHSLIEVMRGMYAECRKMTLEGRSLRASARKMEAWERQARGEVLGGHNDGEDSNNSGSEMEWGEDEDNGEEAIRRREAGALLRSDMDKRITSLCEDATSQKQEIAISLSEVIDSRRDVNGAWELLGRSEVIPEERLFAAAKQAKLDGGGKANKERAKDMIDAYRLLQVLGDVFSKVVEAVAEVGRQEEECRLVEGKTETMLSRRGATDHLLLLSRDLNRVKEDAFALEQRLDQALEQERLHQQAAEEERLNETPAESEDGLRGEGEHPTSEVVKGATTQEEEYQTRAKTGCGGEHDRGWNGGERAPFQAPQHDDAAEAIPQRDLQGYGGFAEESREGVPRTPPDHYGGGEDVDEGSVGVGSEEQEDEFVGEDEEDNVWQ